MDTLTKRLAAALRAFIEMDDWSDSSAGDGSTMGDAKQALAEFDAAATAAPISHADAGRALYESLRRVSIRNRPDTIEFSDDRWEILDPETKAVWVERAARIR